MKAVIDRIEGDYAVLLFGDAEKSGEIPLEALPSGVKEGDWLDISFAVDKNTTSDRKKRVEGLLEKLKNKQR